MITIPSTAKITQNDKLVIRWKLPNGITLSQGKRVSANCPLSKNEREIYVKQGPIKCVAAIKTNRNISTYEALNILNSARGKK